MADPALELQRTMVARLKADAAVSAAVGVRVYDHVPQDVSFPYVSIGDIQILDDAAECVIGTEAFVTIHVWSRSVGLVETRSIAAAVRGALHEAPLVLNGFSLIECRHRDTMTRLESDGLTGHAVISFRGLVDQL